MIVEVKTRAAPEAAGSPRKGQPRNQMQQLGSYIEAQLAEEDKQLVFVARRSWVGVLTDGGTWYAWLWRQDGKQQELISSIKAKPGQERNLYNYLQTVILKTTRGKMWVPHDTSSMFSGESLALQGIYDANNFPDRPALDNKRELWLELLRGSGMAPEKDDHKAATLFVQHTYLVTIARAVIGALTEDMSDDDPKQALKEGFVAWVLDIPEGREWANRIYQAAFSYDWRTQATDVLRRLYMDAIKKEERKLFGEYYTPDWLAGMLVEKVLDERWLKEAPGKALDKSAPGKRALAGVGVLDPACGSGTFLFHAAKRILQSQALAGATPRERAEATARLLHGIDIHPVAVEMSRATLMRALPTPPTGGVDVLDISQGDSLLSQVDPRGLLQKEPFAFPSKANPMFNLPQKFLLAPKHRKRVSILVESAKKGESTPPREALAGMDKRTQVALGEAHQEIKALCKKRGNSVWTWLIVNVAAPLRLKAHKVDRIVANPPWLRLSEVQVRSRKTALEEMAGSEKLWVGGKQATGFDIGALFVKCCRGHYLSKDGVSGWVLNRASLTGGNWKKFHDWVHKELHYESTDLSQVKASPFSGAKAAVWTLRNARPGKKPDLSVRRELCMKNGRTIAKDRQETWAEVKDKVVLKEQAAASPKSPSGYMKGKKCDFKNGATIFPYCLVKVHETHDAAPRRGMPYRGGGVETVQPPKHPWNNVGSQKGDVPARWVVNTVYSQDLLPFCLRKQVSKAVLPLDENGLLEERPEKNEYWKQADNFYAKNAGKGGNTPQTLLGCIDYGAKLSSQLPAKRKPMVFYNKAGQYLRAAAVVTDKIAAWTVYRLETKTLQEAEYLAALLNADSLQKAFAGARKSDRDFETHIWRAVPIPRYDPEDELHQGLARLGREAADQAGKAREELPPSTGQIKASAHIREQLRGSGIMGDINDAAVALLPKQAR